MSARPVAGELALAVVLGVLVTWAWRGAWYALDAGVFPGAPVRSGAASLLGGSALFLALAVAQPALYEAARSRRRRLSWVGDVLFSYGGLWASVGVWRGAWVLADVALRDCPVAVDAWLSHAAAAGALVALGALRSSVAPPVTRAADAAPPLFGAMATPGLDGFGRANAARWRAPPDAGPPAAWHAAVGVPFYAPAPGADDAAVKL